MRMVGEPPPPNGNERLARLVTKYRARRTQRQARYESPAETFEQFGQRVFGDEIGEQVLLDYLREHTSWLEPEAHSERVPVDGR